MAIYGKIHIPTITMPKPQNNAVGSSSDSKKVTQHILHHDLLLQYARQACKYDAELKSIKIQHHYQHSNCGETLPGLVKSVKETIKILGRGDSENIHEERLHQILFKVYKEKRNTKLHLPWNLAFSDDGYVFHHLIYHMIQTCNYNTCRGPFALLENKDFITGRVLSLGVRKGVKRMIGRFRTSHLLVSK